MIVVTGGTGQLGSAIARELVRRIGPAKVGVSVRKPDEASALAALGVRVRRGDFADPSSLGAAFEGASRVILISSNARAHGGDTLAQHRAAIDAAQAAGVQRILYTSHMAASAGSAFPPMHDHAATEAMLASSGVAWTALRNGFYASSAVALLGEAPASGVLMAPADGPVSWTTHADLAEAAAIIASDGGFDGPTPPLTATEALDLGALASIGSSILGKTIRREVLTDDELRARMAARGAAPHLADIALGLYRAARAGEFAAVDPTLSRLLGRPPLSMRAFLEATLGARRATN